MQAGLISVVIPTFNRSCCLPSTIESVLSQTYQNFEVIVVDDGSTDDTRTILAERFPKEPRLRYLHQENRGVSAARNRGLAEARGEFVALLDSDDLWQPWKLEAQVAALRRFPAATLAHSDMEAIDPGGTAFEIRYLATIYDNYRNRNLPDLYPESVPLGELLTPCSTAPPDARVWFGDIYEPMLFGNLMHTSTIVLRRDELGAFPRYDETLRLDETFEFHLAATRIGPVAFVDASTTRYRRGRSDHLWSAEIERARPPAVGLAMDERYLRLLQHVAIHDGPRLRLPGRALDHRVADVHAWVARGALAIGDRPRAIRHLFASLRKNPLKVRRAASLAVRIVLGRA